MKWFQHETDARNNKKIRKIERQFSESYDSAMAAVGRYWRLLEIIGDEGARDENGAETFNLPADYDLELLAEDLRCTVTYLEDFLSCMAEINAIDPETWRTQRLIFCPKLAKRASEYEKKKERRRRKAEEKQGGKPEPGTNNSGPMPPLIGQKPDNVRTLTGECLPTIHNNTIHNKTVLKDLADGTSAVTPPKANGRDYEKEFNELFYPAYPNKKKPAYARQCYVRKGKKGELPPVEVLLAALEDQKSWQEWTKEDGRYIDHPSTWINSEGWKNERTGAPGVIPERKIHEEEDRRTRELREKYNPTKLR